MDRVTGWRASARRTKAAVAPVLLLAGTILSALSLLSLRSPTANSGSQYHLPFVLVLFSFPVWTATIALFLWRARYRIQHLEAKEAEALQTAGVDPLSGLPNRFFFDRLLGNAIAQSTSQAPVALVTIDVDRFKNVNDCHGHQAGDRLIVGIAERIKRIIRDEDCLARVGGDEFALMLINTGNPAQCAAMVHRIHDAMLAPFDIGRAQVYATLSIGVALCPQDGDTCTKLIQAADLALYRAKEEGRNRFAFFDKTMEHKLHLGLTIEDDLRAAIKADELTIQYQPLISGADMHMIGVEALVRWNHPQLGLMSPEDFIPVAESRGLIAPLGEWVLARACRDASRWPTLRLAVNVSPVQFRQGGFVETVKTIIETSGIDPGRLDLELTEGVLIQDADQAEHIIMELRALGVRMGLDDFGAGYSSMIYLRRFAFDKIKIDRAFLGSMEMTGEGAIIIESIVTLGHALGLTVTVEGVEYPEQVAFLKKLGCDEMQGFLLGHPVDADEIDARLSLKDWHCSIPSTEVAGPLENKQQHGLSAA
jgi:diguanylate cyclase (GGDEF)-like protein